jgi:aryl-alcohol dehydrogenase-like predicted oxidoreductase
MRKVKIPKTGLEVSALTYGTCDWGSRSEAPLDQLYDAFREAGGNTFDTAHCYAFWSAGSGASERALGKLVREKDKRSDVFLITKGGHPPDPPRYPRADRYLSAEVLDSDVRDSLERLGVDYIDLYFLHRDDPRTPVGEIMDALAPHVQSGRLHGLGASHWSPARIAAANEYAAGKGIAPFVASQPGWSLAHPTSGNPYPKSDRTWHERTQLALFAFSPTAHGYFSKGSDAHFDNPVSQARLERARKLGAELGATPSQIALAWLMYQPFPVVPILGTLNPDHLADALGAAKLELSSEQVKWIEGDEV